jgi:hypothetical protein
LPCGTALRFDVVNALRSGALKNDEVTAYNLAIVTIKGLCVSRNHPHVRLTHQEPSRWFIV